MERAGDVIWRPMPYIAVSEDGSDATGHFKGITDLVVPATLGFRKHVAKEMDELEVRDDLRQHRFGKAAAERLAADVNMAVMDAVCNQGTLIATKTTAAAGFEDPADVDSVLNRNGIPQMGRQIAYSTKDYNALAKNLADRGTMNSKPTTAYERALIGENVSGFVAHKLDYANICNDAAATGITGVCGSGIIELIAELYLASVIAHDGTIRGECAERNPRRHPHLGGLFDTFPVII
jgi:hypothetical protein